MSTRIKIVFLAITLGISLLSANILYAQDRRQTGGDPQNNADPVSLTNPLTNNTSGVDIPTLIGRVINGVLGVVGSLALLMFIYGGLLWMTSAGSDEKVKKGKDILVWATLGLIVIFTSYALVHFIIFQGLGAAGGENPEIDAAQKQNNYQTGN
ncbi:hypothetical protein COU00_02430 [Candidatus Falkowbacteria bacterium CG10_big_fil_rev_8_21_14_0_10_43_11]|uniref:Uncharacterized protein n=1 Tax=Candidatus Falkowbacteria bacterium CG10_big_fil_rev_8_21_14_0_10_43_11 TaxID=1974568 RepID=A0A2M6WM41_9BACT|nr:MAG: hypothetical protein COU00_02430 [Candidatus Falkowbacteria bacterium CG10_big_fil_rev_8_21_14_0_10_43_11]